MIDNKFGYENTDKEIELELYGLNFKFKQFTEEQARKCMNINRENIMEIVDEIVGKDKIEKINEKRAQDGYEKMNEIIAMQLLAFIAEKCTVGLYKNMENNIVKNTDAINSIKLNRQQRRYNKYNRRNWR